MKQLLIKEDDSLFKCDLFQPSHLFYFANKKKFVLQMIEKQPDWYWLQFIITFRSAMYERGLVPWKDERRVHCEEAFIAMLDVLADKVPASRSKKVDVLFDDIHQFYKTSALRTNLGPAASFLFTTPAMVATMSRLYGSAQDYPKKYRKFALWSVLASTLVECHKRWCSARLADSREQLPWHAPAHWHEPSKLQRIHLFDQQLKARWGTGLENAVGVPTAKIVWWSIIEVMELEKASQLLPKVSTVEYDLDTMMLYPWDKPETTKHSLGTPENASGFETYKQEYMRMVKMAKEMELSEKEFSQQFDKVFQSNNRF